MIKKIEKIRNFGTYRDFTWASDLPEFRKHNLLYGWNYSGKTTISRVLRSFELGMVHPNYPEATFSVWDGTRSHRNDDLSTLPKVRVFNIDYVTENLKWHSDSENQIAPIFMLGSENIELQEKLAKAKVALVETQAKKSVSDARSERILKELNDKLTENASSIKQLLRLSSAFTRSHLATTIQANGNNPSSHLLTAGEVKSYRDTVLSSEIKSAITRIPDFNFAFSKLLDSIAEACGRSISSKPILALQNDGTLNEWVDEGRKLHASRTECQFCGGVLTPERVKTLDEHFSKEYEILKHDVSELKKTIGSQVESLRSLEKSLPVKEQAFPEFQSRLEIAATEAGRCITDCITDLKTVFVLLEKKMENPFIPLPVVPIETSGAFEKIGRLLSDVDGIIASHNTKRSTFEADRIKKETALKKHYAAECAIKARYFEINKESAELLAASANAQKEVTALSSEIRIIEAQLSETVKGAEKINSYVRQFFQHDELSVRVGDSNRFEVVRGTELAKNLSEGEKTAISLAYFVASLEDKNTTLSDTVVFLDDPISSLDANHLFNTYAFIRNRLLGCEQLFVSTHNLDFLGLMKDLIEEIRDETDSSKAKYGRPEKYSLKPYYLVQRVLGPGGHHSKISDMPKSLKLFRSEYAYLYSVIEGNRTIPDSPEEGLLYVIPNVVRRFMEGYSAQRWPGVDWKENLEKVIGDPVKASKIISLTNRYSHNQLPDAAFRFPEISECRDVISAVLDGLDAFDPEHCVALRRYL